MAPAATGSKLGLVAALERGAGLARRVGLGPLVERLAPAALRSLGPFATEVDGLVLHGANLGQQHYVRELSEHREGTMLRLLLDAVPEGGTVLDGGAYLGWVSLQAARAAGPAGRVVAVEPHPGTADLLQRNVVANGLGGRVEVVRSALGAEGGTSAFHLSGGGDTSSLHNRVGDVETIDVTVVAGDELLGPEAVADVIKLDLEGGELDALRGLERTIARSRRRLTLFVECYPRMLAGSGTSPEALVGWIEAAGLEVRWIDEARGTTEPWSAGGWEGDYVNLVCRPAG
ncbi:MAG TPA: FkbM family methyltransferase [Gaiellaceae bacterium]|nr:FkbM family methyltransferase [Gaiellaceae bacterium]